MAITLDELIDALKIHATHGVEVPKGGHDNETHTPTLRRWAENAAQQINRARRRTTKVEYEITVVDGQYEYELPEDVREIVRIAPRSTSATTNEFSNVNNPFAGPTLPTGQRMAGSLDLIHRMNLTREHHEYEYELIGDNIRFLFPLKAGQVICVTYLKIDRSLDSIPDDRFEAMLTYMLWKNYDWYIGKHGSTGYSDRDWSPIFRRRAELAEQWSAYLDGMGPEADGPAGT